MDWQQLIPWLGPVITTALIGYVWDGQKKAVQAREDIWAAIRASAENLTRFQIEVAKDYVTHVDLREIKDSLIRIEATLAAKADR